MSLWKRIEYWNLRASQCFHQRDVHTATLISVHALTSLHQHVSKTANDNKLDSNYNERINSYIDFISRYSCFNSSASLNQTLPMTPNYDSKIISNYVDKTDVKSKSSNISSAALHRSTYNRYCNDNQDFPATAVASFDLFPVRQLQNNDDEIYSSFFVWKTNAVRKANRNSEYQTDEGASLHSKVEDALLSSCISTDEMTMILIFNIALLYHRRAIQKDHINDYIIAIESYYQALQILEDKVLPKYQKKNENDKNSILKNNNNNMTIDHVYEGTDEQLNYYFHLLSCKSTFLLIKAAILNNLMHMYRIFYHIEEAREVVNDLEIFLLSCNHSDDFDNDESLYYDDFNRRIEHRTPKSSIDNRDSIMIDCHDDSNGNYDDYCWPSISEEDYFFFENNIRFLRMHNFQNAPAA